MSKYSNIIVVGTEVKTKMFNYMDIDLPVKHVKDYNPIIGCNGEDNTCIINLHDVLFNKTAPLWSYRPNVISMVRFDDIHMLTTMDKMEHFVKTKWQYLGENPTLNNIFLDTDDEIFVKSMNQARSTGMHKFKSVAEYIEFAILVKGSDSSYTNIDIINEKYNIGFGDTRSDDDKTLLCRLQGLNLVTQHEVVIFTKEFRILYFKGSDTNEYIIEERFNYAPNSEGVREHKICVLNEVVTDVVASRILSAIQKAGDSLGNPTVAFDLWINEDKVKDGIPEFGLFEYSTYYGTEYPLDINLKIGKMLGKAVTLCMDEL